MTRLRTAIAALGVISICLFSIGPAEAQFKKRLKDRLKRVAEQEVERKAEQEVRKAMRCAMGDAVCIEQAKKDGRPVEIVDDDGEVIRDADGNPVTDPAKLPQGGAKPGTGVWRNYDFVPGRDVWFASDFEGERVGRFPASQLEFVSGNMQIVELDGKKVLEATSSGLFRIKLDRPLPEGFAIEMTISVPTNNISTSVYFTPRTTAHAKHESAYFTVAAGSGLYFRGSGVSTTTLYDHVGKMTPVKFQADGSYAIMYVGTERVANVPNATIVRSDTLEFSMNANAKFRSYISDIVVSVGLDRLYDSLMESGSFTTRGILFGLDSDRLRPESTPVLEEIRSTLERHGDLSIVIEGHTDSQGADDYNMELSGRRATAVVSFLVDAGIDAGRVRAEGKGESDPATDNATVEGRAQNRRVVIRRAE